jgi:hypothetical protein
MEPSTSASEHLPPPQKKRRKLNSLLADIENETSNLWRFQWKVVEEFRMAFENFKKSEFR